MLVLRNHKIYRIAEKCSKYALRPYLYLQKKKCLKYTYKIWTIIYSYYFSQSTFPQPRSFKMLQISLRKHLARDSHEFVRHRFNRKIQFSIGGVGETFLQYLRPLENLHYCYTSMW